MRTAMNQIFNKKTQRIHYIYHTIIFLCTIWISQHHLLAQSPPPPPPLDCIHAIPVCQNTFSFPNGFNGQGMNGTEINAANSCLPNGEKNSTWFSFTVQNGGALRFTITPNVATDDYNWSLFNVTGKSCADIATTNLEVSCNSSTDVLGSLGDAVGRTGANSNPPFYGDLGFVFPAFVGDITVAAGESYILYVSRETGNSGFSIDFGNSTATLFNPATPEFAFISPVVCGDNELLVHFNKPILCNTVQPTDFLLSGNTITQIYSYDCSVLGKSASSTYRLTLATPISSSGNYALNLNGLISDVCNNTNSSDVLLFNVSDVQALAGDDFIFCMGDDVNIQIGDTSIQYASSVNLQWTASSPLVQNAVSNPNIATPFIQLTNVPADTVQLVLTATTGSCQHTDTIYIYFRDCCKNYDAQISQFTNIGCFGASTGDAQATATGSIAGFNPGTFNYQWSSGNNTFLATGLSANTNYTVTVTDQLGCSDTANITLSEPNTPISSSSVGSILACYGGTDGTIDLTVNGATPPYTYQWSNGDTTQDLANIPAGNYIVTITDANNCTITQSEQVTQPPTPINITGSGSTIACGASTGNINISVSGGGTPYQYLWSNGSTSQDINNLTPGTYTVSVTDLFGCTVPQDFTVNTLTNFSATTNATDAPCANSPTGTASVTATGGQSPYQYLWSNNQTTPTISNLLPGLYTVTLTDATNCVIIASATVGVSSSLAVNGSATDVSCFNGNDGAIQTSISGATGGNYTYQWSGTAQTSANINNLNAGNYSLTVTDANGCTATNSFSVSQPSALVPNILTNNITCNGGNDGALSASATGGTPPFQYQWSNGLGITPNVSNLSVGNYSLTITDANGCTATTSANISQPAPMTASATASPTACANAATGSIQTNINGGTAPFSYSWSNSSTAQNPTNLNAGNYSLTITDANGCTATTSATVGTQSPMTASAIASPTACGNAATGSIQTNINGGTAPFSYSWSNNSTAQNPTNLSAGNYSLTITDANGCTATTSATVGTQTAMSANISNTTDVTCANGNDGSITLNITNGTAPYSFAWSDATIGNLQNPTNLSAGNYTVTVADANGCTTTASANIGTLPQMSVGIVTAINVTCFGGNNGGIVLSITNGNAPYSFAWSGNTPLGNIQNPANLSAGNYTVTVTDANGCTATASANIAQPNAALSVVTTDGSVNCFGGNNGQIGAIASGGTTPYSYAWNNGIGNIQNPGNLNAGNYTLTVTDANGCQVTATSTVTEPTALAATLSATPLSCSGGATGSIAVAPSGGTAPYHYTWSSNASTGNTNVANNLSAGAYFVTITDANFCTITRNASITAPSGLNIAFTTNEVSCNGAGDGSIAAGVTGGNAPYTFSWSIPGMSNTPIVNNLTAGTYTLTVTDASGCSVTSSANVTEPTPLNFQIANQIPATCQQNNGLIAVFATGGRVPYSYQWTSNAGVAGNSNTATNLGAGIYSVTVTDANGCSQSINNITFAPAAPFQFTTVVTHPQCVADNGQISIVTAENYTYQWSANANTGNSFVANDLTAGTYSLTITNNEGCDTSINVIVNAPTLLNTTNNITNASCGQANGAIIITVNSGVAPYSYNWDVVPNPGDTNAVNNLNAGTYRVTITDANGCSLENAIAVTGSDVLDVQFSVNAPDCATAGSIALTPLQGTPPFTYTWSSNANTGNQSDADNLGDGTYDVTISDDADCEQELSFELLNEWEFDIFLEDIADNECPNYANGFIDISTNSNSNKLIYEWSNAAVTQDIFNLEGGTYSVTATDQNSGCTAEANFDIQSPEAFTVEVTPNNPTITLGDEIDLNASSDNIGLIYSWAGTNGSIQTGPVASVSPGQTTTYTLSATLDQCPPQIYEVTVTVLLDDELLIPDAFTPNGDGQNDDYFVYAKAGTEITSFQIFNRWGELMHGRNDVSPWDGTHRGADMPNGSYVYVVTYSVGGGAETIRQGQFLLIR